jgi:2-C-methyl-D-erythritol 4-phosphate cytidylyltransferase
MNIAIILSGGIGSRMGRNIPKQYIYIKGKSIIEYSLVKFAEAECIDAIVIAIADEWKTFVKERLPRTKKQILFSPAGETRQLSIFNALKVCSGLLKTNEDMVIVHDAARPLVSKDLIDKCLSNCQYCDGVLPVIPVKDTIYQSADGKSISSLLPRKELFAGQAPEAFELKPYKEAMDRLSNAEFQGINGSTEPAIIAGMDVVTVPGDKKNFKITTQEDLAHFQDLMKGNHSNELQSPF